MKTGTTLAILSADGKIPFEKDLFISSERGKDITSLSCFTILFGKLLVPVLLLVYVSWIISFTSSGEVGEVKKVFRLGCLS